LTRSTHDQWLPPLGDKPRCKKIRKDTLHYNAKITKQRVVSSKKDSARYQQKRDIRTTFGGPLLRQGPSRPPHFPSHRATGNTEEFQNFRVSAFPLRLPSVPLCLCERPTPHACTVGTTMLLSFALPRDSAIVLLGRDGAPSPSDLCGSERGSFSNHEEHEFSRIGGGLTGDFCFGLTPKSL